MCERERERVSEEEWREPFTFFLPYNNFHHSRRERLGIMSILSCHDSLRILSVSSPTAHYYTTNKAVNSSVELERECRVVETHVS